MNWEKSGSPSQHPSPDTVPVGRIGGLLTNQSLAWSATCLPMVVDTKSVLVTPAHVFDGVGTVSIEMIATTNYVDDVNIPLDLGSWIQSEEFDLAAIELSADVVSWQFWRAKDEFVYPDPSGQHEGDQIQLAMLPRPFAGGQSLEVSLGKADAPEYDHLEFPGEYVIPHLPDDGDSGSPAFLVADGRPCFAGLVTSAVSEEAACAILRSEAILDFLRQNFG